MVDDTIPHMLFVCPGMAVKRDTGWAKVLQHAPEAMISNLHEMMIDQNTQFILSGLGSFVTEWCLLFEYLCMFVVDIYLYKKINME